MSNKLPWFTHDHDARNDEFLQRSMDKFGHFGYAAYFMLLEIIHEHGVGGIVTMSQSRLAQNLRSRWPQVRLYLDFSRTSGKVDFTLNGTEVQLQNKKFIQRQGKLKFKTPPTLQQHSVKTPQEGEREEERERHNTKGPSRPPSEVQLVVEAYKKLKGIAFDDAKWNEANFPRFSKSAKALISSTGCLDNALSYLKGRGDYLASKRLEWTLETIAKNAADLAPVSDPKQRAEELTSTPVDPDLI